jgi:16S rRNA (cytosine1402-N4)-methyltransferase
MKVICLDADSSIMEVAKKRLECYSSQITFYNQWFNQFFRDYPDNIERPDRILFDLGISTFHYEKSERGFSFRKDEKLDMRLDENLEISAADIVNTYPEVELARIIYEYGEERYSRRIASAIVRVRKESRFEYAKQLADTVYKAVPAAYRRGRNHPATKTFQAIRIHVNGELARLEEALEEALRVLKTGGKMGVISFHSLEDRIVKRYFKKMSLECVCPPEVPQCNCRGKSIVKLITKKPVAPDDSEIRENLPSRSSKLRVVEKVNEL